MSISEDLLEILVCPKCKGQVRLNTEENGTEQRGLVCEPCGLLYEIRDDIPIMLVEEARDWHP